MPTNTEFLKRFESLDGVRGIAAVVVVLSHLPLVTNGWLFNFFWQLEHSTRFAYIMLDEFFLMSGFFITRILLNERRIAGEISLKSFYLRRVLRIFPIYYLTIAVCYFIFHFRPAELASLLTYTFNVYHPLNPDPSPMEHTWSLAVEEQFYLFWPLLIGAIPLNRLAILTGTIVPLIAVASGIVMAIIVGTGDQMLAGNIVYMSLLTRMLSISLGGWLAVREFEGRPFSGWPCVLLATTAIFMLVMDRTGRDHGMITSQGFYWVIALLSYALLSVSFTATVIFGGGRIAAGIRRFLEFSGFRGLGQISYALYLYHLPVLFYFGLNDAAIQGGKADIGTVSLALAIAFSLAIISLYFIERPLMSLRHWFRIEARSKLRNAPRPDAPAETVPAGDPAQG